MLETKSFSRQMATRVHKKYRTISYIDRVLQQAPKKWKEQNSRLKGTTTSRKEADAMRVGLSKIRPCKTAAGIDHRRW